LPGKKVCGLTDLILVLLIGLGLTGCSDSGAGGRVDILVQVGKSVVTADEFNQVFDMAGYVNTGGDESDSHQYEAARLRILNQLTEELIIVERARELSITVSDPELETEIVDTKRDYPDNTFEKTLLENAILFQAWRKQLRRHMLVKKVIEKELEEQALITLDDIRTYYHDNPTGGNERAGQKQGTDGIDFATVVKLRRDKALQAYQPWIKELYKKYQIKINHSLWNKITDSPARDKEFGTVPD